MKRLVCGLAALALLVSAGVADAADYKKMTIREKLELMKEISQRNRERRKEYLEQEKRERNEKLFDLYVNGMISREDFERRIKE